MVSGVRRGVQSGEGRGVTGWKIEGVQQAAVRIFEIADQHEVHIVTGHTVGLELRHDQRGGIGTLRIGENHDGILGAHSSGGYLAFDIGDHDLLVLTQRRAVPQAFGVRRGKTLWV